MSRRLVLAGIVLTVVSACGGVTVTSDEDRPADPSEATAYSLVDGVETWDLTGEPSDEAFGIPDDSSAGVYETPAEPRMVRLVLPDRTVQMPAVLVTFFSSAGSYSFSVRSEQLEPDRLTGLFRDVLGQLDVDDALADDFARQVAAAPPDQSERIEIGLGATRSVRLGKWSVGPSASIAPLAGSGRVNFSGTWPPI